MKYKYMLFFLLAFWNSGWVYGQNKLTIEEFNTILNKKFSSIITGNTINAPGNYVAVDTDGGLSLSGFFVSDKSVWTIKAKGQSLDGAIPVFTNSKFNNGISLGIQYHTLKYSKYDKIDLPDNRKKIYERKKKAIELKWDKEYKDIENKVKSSTLINNKIDSLETSKLKLQQEIDNRNYYRVWLRQAITALLKIKENFEDEDIYVLLKDEMDELIVYISNLTKEDMEYLNDRFFIEMRNDLKWMLNTLPIDQKYTKKLIEKSLSIFTKEKIDSLKNQLLIKIKKNDDLIQKEQKKLAEIGNIDLDTEWNIIDIKKDEELEALNKKTKLDIRYNMNWFSFGVTMKKDNYLLLDKSQIFSEQISEKNFVGVETNIQYFYYRDLPTSNELFINLGGVFTYGNNIGSLTKLSVSNEDTLGSSDSVNRKSTSTFYAYKGTYKSNLSGLILYADIFTSFFKQKKFKLHLNPKITFLEDEKPLLSSEIGLVIPFKKTTDITSNLNVELFYRFNDISNSLESDKVLFERNTIGLRLSVPFQF